MLHDLAVTKDVESRATPGPWLYCTKTYDGMPLVVAEGYGFPAEPMRQTRGIVCYPEADAEFIAHARTAVPALVAAVERVQALHTPDEFGMCEGCGDNEHGYAIVPHPCPTIRELEIK